MREALHVNNQQLYFIPQDLSDMEIENHKQNANKGTFICPYCEAKLKVRSGPVLGNYFAHLHGEGCEPSQQSEARSKKYEQLKKDDTPRHPQIVAIMLDELEVIAKTYENITCTRGYLNPDFTKKYIPDITLKIYERRYAITIFTNISPTTDQSKAKSIQKQREYYASLGYEPLFFIERSNLAIDIDKESLVLWVSENEALSAQPTDHEWRDFFNTLATSNELNKYLNIPEVPLDIKSIMYITPADQTIAVQSFHVIPIPSIGPPKAYFFAAPYTLTFSAAFKITNDQLLLANKNIEAQQNSRDNQADKETRLEMLRKTFNANN